MPAVPNLATGDTIDEAFTDACTDKTTQYVGRAAIATSSATFTTIADITGLSVTFTAETGRRYKISFFGNVSTTVANDQIGIYITTSGGTVEASGYNGGACGANRAHTMTVVAVVTPGAGSVTYKIRGERVAGTGNCSVFAGSTAPAYIIVEDLGK